MNRAYREASRSRYGYVTIPAPRLFLRTSACASANCTLSSALMPSKSLAGGWNTVRRSTARRVQDSNWRAARIRRSATLLSATRPAASPPRNGLKSIASSWGSALET